MVRNAVHNAFWSTLTTGTTFPCVPVETTPVLDWRFNSAVSCYELARVLLSWTPPRSRCGCYAHVLTSLTDCFAEYEQRTLYGALVVTLAMLLRLIKIIIIIIIIMRRSDKTRSGRNSMCRSLAATRTWRRQISLLLWLRLCSTECWSFVVAVVWCRCRHWSSAQPGQSISPPNQRSSNRGPWLIRQTGLMSSGVIRNSRAPQIIYPRKAPLPSYKFLWSPSSVSLPPWRGGPPDR